VDVNGTTILSRCCQSLRQLGNLFLSTFIGTPLLHLFDHPIYSTISFHPLLEWRMSITRYKVDVRPHSVGYPREAQWPLPRTHPDPATKLFHGRAPPSTCIMKFFRHRRDFKTPQLKLERDNLRVFQSMGVLVHMLK
jgi:hypothetical protein